MESREQGEPTRPRQKHGASTAVRATARCFRHPRGTHRDEHTYISHELSARCAYWRWMCIEDMCSSWYELEGYTFHGCRLGLTNDHWQPMLKTWTIATDMTSLRDLDSFKWPHQRSKKAHGACCMRQPSLAFRSGPSNHRPHDAVQK